MDDPLALGQATETAFFKHLFTRYYDQTLGFSYWQNKKKEEVDLVVDLEGQRTVPFEIKYRSTNHTKANAFPALREFCTKHGIESGYVITRELEDFGTLMLDDSIRIQKNPYRSRLLLVGTIRNREIARYSNASPTTTQSSFASSTSERRTCESIDYRIL